MPRATRDDHLEIKEMARRMLAEPDYRKNLQERLINGWLAPNMEIRLWEYAYGKPMAGASGEEHDSMTGLAAALRLALQKAYGAQEETAIAQRYIDAGRATAAARNHS